jgi:metallo-beta-lactamase class B
MGAMRRIATLALCLCCCVGIGRASAQTAAAKYTAANPEWNRAVEPVRIADNLYYVGAAGVSSYLITTPAGLILVDTGYRETVPIIDANLTKLGFHLADVRLLLTMHAHFDHVAGVTAVKARSKARLLVNPADAPLFEHGGRNDFAFGDKFSYPPVKPDGFLRDGEPVGLGGVMLTPHFTPGHTKGSTTYTMTVRDGGREYHVVFTSSVSTPEYQLVDNPKYPTIIKDFESTFATLRALPCDIFLSQHGWDFDLLAKIQRRVDDPAHNPFVDPDGYRRYIDKMDAAMHKLVAEQSGKAPHAQQAPATPPVSPNVQQMPQPQQASASQPPAAGHHDHAFWKAIAQHDNAPPAGADVPALARELGGFVASPDPELRDEFGYSILVSWIFQQHLLAPDVVRALTAEWSANLTAGIGSIETDEVFRRSFSALMLSVIVATDNATPFLEAAEVQQLLAAALDYLRDERDLRGYDPRTGWMHSAAHTADLLKFLARSRYLRVADQPIVLDAIVRKLRDAAVVFTHGEDERLARTALAILNRADLDAGMPREWLKRSTPVLPTNGRPDPALLRGNQNVTNLFAKLEVLLSVQTAKDPAREPINAVRDDLRATLAKLF